MAYEKMDPARKRQWIKDLRSGEFVQGQHLLRRRTVDGVKHCCLGVLSQRITGLAKEDLTYSACGLSDETMMEFYRMNDDEGRSFDHIAGWIEANL